MNWQIIIPAAITIVLAVVGWVVGHKLTSQRDIKNKQREIRTKYLLDAYEAFMVAGRNGTVLQNHKEIERAVYTIEMFGTLEQVELCRRFTKEMAQENSSNFTTLVVCIRNFVRSELALADLGDGINMLRIDPINPENNKSTQSTAKTLAD